jgi:3-methylcrotonyl-CoA carboxylase alpha subunit
VPPSRRVVVRGDLGTSSADVTQDGVVVDGMPARVSRIAPAEYRIEVGGRTFTVFAIEAADGWWAAVDGRVHRLTIAEDRPAGGTASRRAHHEAIVAPMPATVIRILVAPGARVARGDTLILLEAMKMELPLRSPRDGVVGAISCREGELVQPDVPLVDIED